jgi:hypothetical protein
VWRCRLSGVRCGIEPLDEGAMNVGRGRVHWNDVFERARSERVVGTESRIPSGVFVEVGVDRLDVDMLFA